MIATAPDGETLAYDLVGPSGATPLMTVHGLVSSAQHWCYFTPHYRAVRPVLTWEYRGHGGHPVPRDRHVSIAQFADDAYAVWRAAGVAPVVVTGLSFGVQVALEVWRRYPEMVRALVLICGTAGQPFAHVPGARMIRRAATTALRGLGAHPVLAAPALRFLRSPTGRRIACEVAYASGGALRDSCPRSVLDDLFGHVGALDATLLAEVTASYLEHDAWDVLPTITVPTLIIAGDRDQLTPVTTAERMRDAVPGSELVVFPGHSHLVQVEDPTGVHRTVDAFLAKHAL